MKNAIRYRYRAKPVEAGELKRNGFLPVLLTAMVLMLSAAAPAVFASGNAEQPAAPVLADSRAAALAADTKWDEGVAVFAGGCFWGVEAVFEHLEGVENVVSGYSGGDAETAKYKMVGTGTTGHAEAVRIEYDPDKISYGKLLEIFFSVAHDPTQLNYQGPDVGTEYRSVVFYTQDEQETLTESYIRELDSKGVYKDPIVTEVVPLDAFYPAEDYHQNFMRDNPKHPYIVYWDAPKIEHLKEAYPELVKDTM